jgi:Na+-translocating ferredoxin:NAD+ oxidoreductase RnfG subunit
VISVGIILALFAACCAIEGLRKLLFRFTVDKIEHKAIVAAERVCHKRKETIEK